MSRRASSLADRSPSAPRSAAISTFRTLINASPDHPRASEAMLAIANCQIELKETKAAKRTLDELLKAYPQSEAAAAGKQRVATLK